MRPPTVLEAVYGLVAAVALASLIAVGVAEARPTETQPACSDVDPGGTCWVGSVDNES